MEILNLSRDEITNLLFAASVAEAEGKEFRIAFDGGFKYKVGQGMWTAPLYGRDESY